MNAQLSLNLIWVLPDTPNRTQENKHLRNVRRGGGRVADIIQFNNDILC